MFALFNLKRPSIEDFQISDAFFSTLLNEKNLLDKITKIQKLIVDKAWYIQSKFQLEGQKVQLSAYTTFLY